MVSSYDLISENIVIVPNSFAAIDKCNHHAFYSVSLVSRFCTSEQNV